jgi:hypothetical protein
VIVQGDVPFFTLSNSSLRFCAGGANGEAGLVVLAVVHLTAAKVKVPLPQVSKAGFDFMDIYG